jgi:lauroyl/myristoyl acyltransferase
VLRSTLVTRLADSVIDPLAVLLSPLLPRFRHPGKRALMALGQMPACGIALNKDLARSMLAARWREALLLARARALTARRLPSFIDSTVHIRGAQVLEDCLATRRPLVFATPHFGACVLGCLALARSLQGQRRLALLYQRDPRNAGLRSLFLRADASAALLSGTAGIVRALQILGEGGAVATMPDVFDDIADTVAIPLFGRWLRVASGTAYLAARSQALIVPGYVRSERGPGVGVELARPIDARDCASGDVRQTIFALMRRLFAEFESGLRHAPEHWLYWERLPRVSTPLGIPVTAEAFDVTVDIAMRCRAFPGLLRRVPELRHLVGARAP